MMNRLKDDIDKAIDLTVSKEENAEEEADILKGILKFGDVLVKQIMTSRVDAVSVEEKIDFEELIEIIKEYGYSRIPVFKEDFDNVEGILYVKDLLGHTDKGKGFKWQELIRRDVFFIPESKKINELLKEFQSKRLHIAVVVDEYGGTSGIVTLEDIMEEIIGDIRDEFDERCLYFFGGTPFASNCPYLNDKSLHGLCEGLWAMRCGQYKIHWISRDNPQSECRLYEQPLLFNINWDPSEKHPIYPFNDNYDEIVTYFDIAQCNLRQFSN